MRIRPAANERQQIARDQTAFAIGGRVVAGECM
jgi:hypothetical protein